MKNLRQIVVGAVSARCFSGVLLAGILLGALPLAAQLPSNASLKGAYYVRYLGVYTDSSSALCALSPCPLSFQGIMTFDGNGNFQLTGEGITPSSTSQQNPLKFASSGQYFVNSSGWFGFSSPFDPAGQAWQQGGIGVGAGAIVASSGGWNYYDLFVGIPVSAVSSSATLSGNYYVAGLGFWSGAFLPSKSDQFVTENTLFSMMADGKGGLGNVTVKSENGAAPGVQTSSSATYALNANGSGTLSLPAASILPPEHLLAGDKVLYVSPDGNFFVAGGSSAYEMILGVKAFAGSAPNNALQGTYFRSTLVWDGVDASSSTGAVSEISSLKLEVGDEWDTTTHYGNYDATYQEDFTFAADGTRSTSTFAQVVGAGGMFVIGTSVSPPSSLALRVKAPAMSGSGVFLNPQGVVNAANNAPFTSNVAPGELILLYGSGLASQTVTASNAPFPTTLGGVQVSVGGMLAPLYYVSPTVISAIVPYYFPTERSYQDVKVINNGTASNTVKVVSAYTSPGIFTVPSGGIGNGAILHGADYSLVTPDSPAKAGEIVVLFMTGLGVTAPLIADGAAGPTNPLSLATAPDVYIDGAQAKVLFAGLAPSLAGLYQLNLTIPDGVSTGNVTIEIDTYDGTTTMATIPIGK